MSSAVALCDMLILTGQRREEGAGMTWAELADDAWTIPANRAKNGATHIIPLSALSQDLLRGAPRFGELVFPAPSMAGRRRRPLWKGPA
jgi:integrase